ncbi:MAG TPA: hypothetical protein VMM35_02195 [Longimicrobiales bacterium]|nr:hypothetical protein [Longimicrobiales bacterium]
MPWHASDKSSRGRAGALPGRGGSADVYAAVDGVSATLRVVVSDTATVPPPAP